MVFVDDIFIYSKFEEDHRGHLRVVLQTFREHQLYAKFSKCEFWLTKVRLLRHPEKVKAVMSWERPKLFFEIHGFLGLARYYRRFI